MGLTNRLIPTENDPNGILPPAISSATRFPIRRTAPTRKASTSSTACLISNGSLRPHPNARSGMRGEQLFNQVGCAQCHNPSFTTANDPSLEPFLRNKTFAPIPTSCCTTWAWLRTSLLKPGLDSTRCGHHLCGAFVPDAPCGTTDASRRDLHRFDHRCDRRAQRPSERRRGLGPGVRRVVCPRQSRCDCLLGLIGTAEFDMNGDESVDLFDLPSVTGCFNGDGTDQYDADSPCAVADIDQDGDVDETDANWFAQALGAPFDTADCDGDGVLDIVAIASGSGRCRW